MNFKKIFLFTLLLSNLSAQGQSPQFQGEKLNYYWAFDKLISFQEPMIALGVEYKMPYRLAVSFDAGIGSHFSSNSILGFNESNHSNKNWIVLKTGVQLKYFYKKSYSYNKLKKWRRRVALGRKAKIRNKINRKYFIGLQITYNPESYNSENGRYFTSRSDFSGGNGIHRYKEASIKNAKTTIGFINGYQQRFINFKGYFELSYSIGISFKETQYFKQTPAIGASSSSFSSPSFEAQKGKTIGPYFRINFLLGLF